MDNEEIASDKSVTCASKKIEEKAAGKKAERKECIA
jgi:hypothetical protein